MLNDYVRQPRSTRARRQLNAIVGKSGDATMDDLLDTPAYSVLRALQRDGAANMRRFTEASTHTPKHAKILREKMLERGWIAVHEKSARAVSNDIEIVLTPRGRKLAEHSIAIESISEK